jgi:hypothetical protein
VLPCTRNAALMQRACTALGYFIEPLVGIVTKDAIKKAVGTASAALHKPVDKGSQTEPRVLLVYISSNGMMTEDDSSALALRTGEGVERPTLKTSH